MSASLQPQQARKFIEIDLTGKVSKDDYAHLTPQVENLIKEHGKLRILVRMHEFHGFTLGAIWEELKFDVKHFRDIARIAYVGDEKWERTLSTVSKPFTSAEVGFFPPEKLEEAIGWLEA